MIPFFEFSLPSLEQQAACAHVWEGKYRREMRNAATDNPAFRFYFINDKT
jgi:hypothetical protein